MAGRPARLSGARVGLLPECLTPDVRVHWAVQSDGGPELRAANPGAVEGTLHGDPGAADGHTRPSDAGRNAFSRCQCVAVGGVTGALCERPAPDHPRDRAARDTSAAWLRPDGRRRRTRGRRHHDSLPELPAGERQALLRHQPRPNSGGFLRPERPGGPAGLGPQPRARLHGAVVPLHDAGQRPARGGLHGRRSSGNARHGHSLAEHPDTATRHQGRSTRSSHASTTWPGRTRSSSGT